MGSDDGRRVVVTGGTSGIGAAVAARFAADGAAVTALGLRADVLEAPPRVEAQELDVLDGTALEDALGRLDRLDVLVNAAGVIRRGDEFGTDVFREVLEINLTAAMRACTAARPALAAGHGAVVNVASVLTFRGGPLVPGYSASKGGIAALTRSLAVAWAPDEIRVNAVAPGWIRTDLTAALQQDERRSADILDRTPMARWGTPEDVAGVVAFLAGPDAAFVTGVTLPVDGGYLVT